MTNNYRVLVVEDDSEAREAISEELMELKPRGRMECDLSTGVRDATKKVKAKYYDLVLWISNSAPISAERSTSTHT